MPDRKSFSSSATSKRTRKADHHANDAAHTLSPTPPVKSPQEVYNGNKSETKTSSPTSRHLNQEASASRSIFLGPVNDCSIEDAAAEDTGRERLKRHRTEMAGRVWIPEIWGQEELLKEWIDCSVFEGSLVPSGILSAREALVEEARRAGSSRLRIENGY